MAALFPDAASPDARSDSPSIDVARDLERSAAIGAEDRSTWIGGSEAFELLSEPHFERGCARALAYRKVKTDPDFPESEYSSNRKATLAGYLQRGVILEDVAAQLYTRETKRKLIRRNKLILHPTVQGAAVHLDRICPTVVEGDVVHSTRAVEIKTAGEPMFYRILREGLPSAYNVQLQWALFVSGYAAGIFIVLGVFGGDERTGLPLRHFDVQRNPGMMELFKHATENFWDGLAHGELPERLPNANDRRCKTCQFRLTCRGEQIDANELAAVMHEKRSKKPLVSVSNSELDQALYDYALVVSEMHALDSESEEHPGALQLIRQRIRELVGEGEQRLLVNGNWKFSQFETVRSALDQARLRAEQPEIYRKYYVAQKPTGTMQFRVTSVRKDEKDERECA